MLSTEDADESDDALEDSLEWNGGRSISLSMSISIGEEVLDKSESISMEGNGMHFKCLVLTACTDMRNSQ